MSLLTTSSIPHIFITSKLASSFTITPPPHYFVSFLSSSLTKLITIIKHTTNKHVLHVSADDQTTQDLDSKLVPLNPEDPNYGPPALLLLGFQLKEADKIQQLLKDLDGEFLRLVFCTQHMVDASLWDAINTGPQRLDEIEIAKSVPRICFLSGLTGEEMLMFIEAFQESADVEPAVFAAMVPNSAHKPLRELIDEIMADHEMTQNLG